MARIHTDSLAATATVGNAQPSFRTGSVSSPNLPMLELVGFMDVNMGSADID